MLLNQNQILELIPHKPPVVLIDQLVRAENNSFESQLEIREDLFLFENGALTETALLEHIAQTCAAGFGYLGKKDGKKPSIGYIGAITRVNVTRTAILGEIVRTNAEITHRLDAIVMIKGVCRVGEEVILEGELKLILEI